MMFRNWIRLQNRRLRDTSNPFELPEIYFRQMFRLSRSVAQDFLDEILTNSPDLKINTSNAIPFQLKYLAALNFFGHGSYQKPTGENKTYCMSQSMVSRSLHLVVGEIRKLSGNYIVFPETPGEIASAKADFFFKYQMPGIVCAIDGTHIAIIQPPSSQNGHLFFNRKQHYSLNVLAACSSNNTFLYSNANYPGSVHDSAVWQMSGLKEKMPENAYILGDCGFPSEKCMLTPVHGAIAGSSEDKYNIAHRRTRSIIERAFGMLKMRWRCLWRFRTLHYNPKTSAEIVYACMVLHNLCIRRNLQLDTEMEEIELSDDESVALPVTANLDGRRTRANYIRRNF